MALNRLPAAALLFLSSLALTTPLAAQNLEEFLGYPPGSAFTLHSKVIDWFEHLDRQSDRVELIRYGVTPEGRDLVYAVIATPDRIERIDETRMRLAALRDPATSREDATRIIAAGTPAVVWLAYGIHGNESSSSEAAMVVARELASGERDDLLSNIIVIIDPMQNPDGRDRYVSWFKQKRGRQANAFRGAAEHREPWPGGRYSHYLFDMNRDWAWSTQDETRARIAAYMQWHPQVFVDLHEMSYNSNYFFPPDAQPVNANVPAGTVELLEQFGRGNAAEFTARRWPFFVGERFDLFYPGYGDAWPSLRGAVGMTYEVAGGGSAGLEVRREDGEILSLSERVQRHTVASMTTLRTAAALREKLLMHSWFAAHASLSAPLTTWLLDSGDPNAGELVAMLTRQGIEVGRTDRPLRIEAADLSGGSLRPVSFPAGTLTVSSRQTLGALARTLLERQPFLSDEFVRAQRRSVERDEGDEFYDITAWSLPIAMNVTAWYSPAAVPSSPFVQRAATAMIPTTAYAWLVSPHQPDYLEFLSRVISSGIRFRVSRVPLDRNDPRALPAGTLVIRDSGSIREDLQRAAEGLNVTVQAADEVWRDGRVSLGSADIVPVTQPKIAVIGGEGFDPTSFGALWHTLDVELGMPHSIVTLRDLRPDLLDEFNVLLLPDGRPALERELGKDGLARLKQWVEDGGTIVAIKGSAAALRKKDVEFSSIKPWEPEKDAPQDLRNDFRVPGTAFRTVMSDGFLTWGVHDAPAVMLEGSDFLRPTGRRTDDVVMIADENPVVAGFTWPESIERVEGAAWLTHERLGDGNVITFADEPVFRGFWRGTLPFLVNAITYGPTFSR